MDKFGAKYMEQSPFTQAQTFINATAARFELSRQILELVHQMMSQDSSTEEKMEAEKKKLREAYAAEGGGLHNACKFLESKPQLI